MSENRLDDRKSDDRVRVSNDSWHHDPIQGTPTNVDDDLLGRQSDEGGKSVRDVDFRGLTCLDLIQGKLLSEIRYVPPAGTSSWASG